MSAGSARLQIATAWVGPIEFSLSSPIEQAGMIYVAGHHSLRVFLHCKSPYGRPSRSNAAVVISFHGFGFKVRSGRLSSHALKSATRTMVDLPRLRARNSPRVFSRKS